MLNLSASPPVALARYQVPDCQPLAMRYYHDGPDTDYLFIAGGALGVWRLTLCSSWFHVPPVLCPVGDWGDLLVQAPIENGYLERKRCVDVEILETGPSTGPVLFALFAASSDAGESNDATELRAYAWTSASAGQVAPPCAFTYPASPIQLGTSLAIDPADGDSIYVGMGKGGIWRVDLTPQGSGWTLSKTQVWTATGPGCTSSHPVQHVRDLSIVRVQTTQPQSVLYAALNYDELLEIRDLGGPAQACSVTTLGTSGPTPHPGYAECVTAIVENNTQVRVAVAAQSRAGKSDDTAAPSTVNGVWVGNCLYVGTGDPDAPVFGSSNPSHSQVLVYEHDFGGAGGLTWRVTCDYPPAGQPAYGSMGWNSIFLRPLTSSSWTHELTLCSRELGTQVVGIDTANGTHTPPQAPLEGFLGPAFRGQDSAVSTVNNGVVSFCEEWTGAVGSSSQLAYFDPTVPYAITPVEGTQSSPCANEYAPTTCSYVRDPELFAAGIHETAHWVKSSDSTQEYFVRGRPLLERIDGNCNLVTSCAGTPCWEGTPNWWLRLKDFSLDPGIQPRTCWRITQLGLPPQGTPPTSGQALYPRWWQFDLADEPDEILDRANDRTQSTCDPRTMTPPPGQGQIPTALYLSRAGSSHMKAVRPMDVESAAAATCLPYGNGDLLPTGSSAIDHKAELVHVELEPNGGSLPAGGPCRVRVFCPGTTAPSDKPRNLHNNHSVVYETRNGSNELMYVWASASGFVASAPYSTPDVSASQSVDCQWNSMAGLPMLALVDVTSAGSGSLAKPDLLRIGLGTQEGHAYCVATKAYGRKVFAFVGDILGRIWVFKVDGAEILPPPPVQPATPDLAHTYWSTTPILVPVASIDMPRDPVDGVRGNCIDMVIVGNYLYCALARLGVAIVDITESKNPQLIDVMDTPGLALGLSTRTVIEGTTTVTQLIVGDSRCGVRVYQ